MNDVADNFFIKRRHRPPASRASAERGRPPSTTQIRFPESDGRSRNRGVHACRRITVCARASRLTNCSTAASRLYGNDAPEAADP